MPTAGMPTNGWQSQRSRAHQTRIWQWSESLKSVASLLAYLWGVEGRSLSAAPRCCRNRAAGIGSIQFLVELACQLLVGFAVVNHDL